MSYLTSYQLECLRSKEKYKAIVFYPRYLGKYEHQEDKRTVICVAKKKPVKKPAKGSKGMK